MQAILPALKYTERLMLNLEMHSPSDRISVYTRKKKVPLIMYEPSMTNALESFVENETILRAKFDGRERSLIVAAFSFGYVLAAHNADIAYWAKHTNKLITKLDIQESSELFQFISLLTLKNTQRGYFDKTVFDDCLRYCNMSKNSVLKQALTSIQQLYICGSITSFSNFDRTLLLDLSRAEGVFLRAFYKFLQLTTVSGEVKKMRDCYERMIQYDAGDLTLTNFVVLNCYLSSERKEKFIRKSLRAALSG